MKGQPLNIFSGRYFSMKMSLKEGEIRKKRKKEGEPKEGYSL